MQYTRREDEKEKREQERDKIEGRREGRRVGVELRWSWNRIFLIFF